jgi:hypothetical protein
MDSTFVNPLALARYQETLREAESDRRLHAPGTKRPFWSRVRASWNARQRYAPAAASCQPCPEAA